MSSTASDQKLIDAKATLPEPHFDQEATVLSARRVVPLQEVRSFKGGTLLTRPWVLGLGLAGALLVGVFATVIYYSQSNGDNSSLFQGAEIASGAEGASEAPTNSFSGPASPQPGIEEDKRVAITKPAPVNSRAGNTTAEPERKPRPRLVAVIKERKSNNHVEEDREDDRRAARRQARRERRRAERDRRDGKSSDELLRIRDIFEGSPRP